MGLEGTVWCHRWEDVSIHGSALYQCDFCGTYKSYPEAYLSCPKAEECLRRELEDKEREERWEYERMRRERERWEYLRKKYEGE